MAVTINKTVICLFFGILKFSITNLMLQVTVSRNWFLCSDSAFPEASFLPGLAHSWYTPASFTGGHNTRAPSKQTTENLPLITRHSHNQTLDNNIPWSLSHHMSLCQFFFHKTSLSPRSKRSR